MSLECTDASGDIEGDTGSSLGPKSSSSTSGGSPTSSPPPPQTRRAADRYPRTLSNLPENQRFETFEELLTKAGYAHVRVLTPNAEQARDGATYSSGQKYTQEEIHNGHTTWAGSGYTSKVANFLSWAVGYNPSSTSDGTSTEPVPSSAKPRLQSVLSPTSQDAYASQSTAAVIERRSGSPITRLKPKLNRVGSSSTSSSTNPIASSSSTSTIMPTDGAATLTTRPAVRPRQATGKLRSGRVPIPKPNKVTTLIRDRSNDNADSKLPTRPDDDSPLTAVGRPSIPETWLGVFSKTVLSPRLNNRQDPNTSLLFPGADIPVERSGSPAKQEDSSISSGDPSKRSRRITHDPSMGRRPRMPPSGSSRDSQREPGRRKRLPSDVLLSRHASSQALPKLNASPSPVTVLCRSSSLGARSRLKKKTLPLLTPSGDHSAWPSGQPSDPLPPVPRIAVQSVTATGKQPLRRTGSTSSAHTHSLASRRGSTYASLSRVGSSYTSFSRAGTGGTGTSGMASSNGEVGSIGRNSMAPSYRDFLHRPDIHHPADITQPGETDEDSDNEPRLSNIVAPHVSQGQDSTVGPVGRQQSIQSLRACLQRHNSRTSSPAVATFPGGVSDPLHPEDHTPQTRRSSHRQSTRPDPPINPYSSKRNSTGTSIRPERGVWDNVDHGVPRRVEGADASHDTHEDETERGRRGTRLLNLGVGNLRWHSVSSSHARTNAGLSRQSSASRLRNKQTDKDLERERLLWGTTWGRREKDQAQQQ